MKTRALAVNKLNGKKSIITAFDAVYLREFSADKFKNYKFFYIDSSKSKSEMMPKFIKGKNTAFFAFKSESKPENVAEDEGETLTHYAAKKALARMKNLRLIDVKTNKEFLLNVAEAKNEMRFDFEKPYYADIYYQLDSNQNKDMKKYFYKWDGQLAIEIFVSHKVSTEKCISFRENKIPIFEVKIPKITRERFELESQIELSKARIDKAVNNMQRMFEKGIRGVFISDPETEEYQIMCKYKEEIQQFKTAKEKAEKEYNEALQRFENVTAQLKEAELKKDYYDNRVAELEEIIADNKRHPFRFLLKNFNSKK